MRKIYIIDSKYMLTGSSKVHWQFEDACPAEHDAKAIVDLKNKRAGYNKYRYRLFVPKNRGTKKVKKV